MKISIITVTLNNRAGLLRAIKSVRSQTYKNVEHIIVDGGSTDGTLEAINNEKLTIYNLQFISEADNGIYDAINKGIRLATGDLIGLLHSDDFYSGNKVLERYANAFIHRNSNQKNLNPDAVYSDLVYVKIKKQAGAIENEVSKSIDNLELNNEYSVIRNWKSHSRLHNETNNNYSLFTTHHLLTGWMPPHPTLFIRKEVFEKYGLYRTDMKIAADYEMILRLFYKYKITTHYLPLTTYCMTIGGASNKSLKNIIIKSKEDYKALKLHKVRLAFITLLFKNLRKLPQFISK